MIEPSSIRMFLGRRGVVLAGVVLAMLFTSIYPLGRYLSVRGEIAALERQDAELTERAVTLAHERQELQDPTEIEELARERLNFVRPGEVAFAIVDEPESTPERIDLPEPTDIGVFERWWSAVRRAVT